MRVLITGFDKFGGESINPSSLCVNSLPNVIDNIEIKKITLPTVFKDSSRVLEENIDSFSPNIVICVGQAGGRSKITPERIAINIDDARIPDNIGNSPIDEVIRKDGENAYFSTLPIKAIVDELNKNNIPSAISNTAGTFVCNHIMYEALYLTSKKYPNIKLTINTDAHHVDHLDFMKYGVATAQKGFVNKDRVINTMTRDAFKNFINNNIKLQK